MSTKDQDPLRFTPDGWSSRTGGASTAGAQIGGKVKAICCICGKSPFTCEHGVYIKTGGTGGGGKSCSNLNKSNWSTEERGFIDTIHALNKMVDEKDRKIRFWKINYLFAVICLTFIAIFQLYTG